MHYKLLLVFEDLFINPRYPAFEYLLVPLYRHDYERALHINPLCLPARVNLAYTLQVAGKYQQAWHQFTKAVKINPSKSYS